METKPEDSTQATRAWLTEFERTTVLATELTSAFAQAALQVWAQGVRISVEAYAAGLNGLSKEAKDLSTGKSITKFGERLRGIVTTSSTKYADAVRDGVAQYQKAAAAASAAGEPASDLGTRAHAPQKK